MVVRIEVVAAEFPGEDEAPDPLTVALVGSACAIPDPAATATPRASVTAPAPSNAYASGCRRPLFFALCLPAMTSPSRRMAAFIDADKSVQRNCPRACLQSHSGCSRWGSVATVIN